MIIFDLREEARLMSCLYLVAALALGLGMVAAAPAWLHQGLPSTWSRSR